MRKRNRSLRNARQPWQSPWPWLAVAAAMVLGVGYWYLLVPPQTPTGAAEATAPNAPRIFNFYELLRQSEVRVETSAQFSDDAEEAWFVQAGNFAKSGNARRRLKQIRELGYDSARIERQRDGIYRVVLGPYRSRGKIQRLRQQLQRQRIDTVVSLQPVPSSSPQNEP